MSDLQIIKDRLLNEDKVHKVFEAIGCEHVSYSGGRVEGQLPAKFKSDNKRAVQCKLNNNSLNCAIRNKGDFSGDIYFLVSYIHFDKRGQEELVKDLYNAKSFICNLFGWQEYLDTSLIQKRKDYVAPLKSLLGGRRRLRDTKPNPVLPDSVMDEYWIKGNPVSFQDWIDEGIPHKVQMMYDVGIDITSKRIVFPIKNRFGQIVGVKGRLIKTEDAPKYKYIYLHKCNNGLELFNLHYALEYINMLKKVYVFESEKSCMKAFALGIFNTVALGSSEITEVQADTIKKLGLDVEIVLCYDEGITIDEIKVQAEHFKGRKVFATYDTEGILEKKASPIDQGLDTWNELLENHCYKIVV